MKYKITLVLLVFTCSSFSQGIFLTSKPCDFLRVEKRTGVACGYIVVPEDHNRSNGRKIKIAYAILKARDTNKQKIPIILINGGPGGQALINMERWIDNPLRNEQDLIIFDQRGIGFSSELPNPDIGIFKILAGDFNVREEYQRIRDTLALYKKKCSDQQIKLEYYITSQSAADVDMLMEKLGYHKYALYGESYGTRLARVVMDKYPQRISCVIADAPAILESDFLTLRIRNFNDGLEKVFTYCENDSNCKKIYPNLRSDYFTSVKELEKDPMQLTIGGSPFYVNPQDALFMLRYQLYSPNSKTDVPLFVRALKERDTAALNSSQQFLVGFVKSLNLSMFLSTERNEEYDMSKTPQDFNEIYASLPNLPTKLGFFNSLYEAASDWHTVSLTNKEKVVKACAIPTLIFVNKFDPVTPPKNGAFYKESLVNATLLVLDLQGHGVTGDCATQVMINFIRNPRKEINTDCLPLVK